MLAVYQQSETLDRARDFLGNPRERWDDRLRLEGKSYVEQYRDGRMAIVLHLEILPVQTLQSDPAGGIEENRRLLDCYSVLVLKADIANSHKLDDWDEKLVFIRNVEFVKSPEGRIPSLVGFYRIENEVVDSRSDLLLMQSAINGCFKLLPRVANWKLGMAVNDSTASNDNFGIQNVQCASQVVQRIPDYYGGSFYIEPMSQIQAKPDPLTSVFLDRNLVEVRLNKSFESRFKVVDVMIGPFNLSV